jgi:hypothetical protein
MWRTIAAPMTTPIDHPGRSWRQIARELAHEENASRRLELREELHRAMAEQGKTDPFQFDAFQDNRRSAP